MMESLACFFLGQLHCLLQGGIAAFNVSTSNRLLFLVQASRDFGFPCNVALCHEATSVGSCLEKAYCFRSPKRT